MFRVKDFELENPKAYNNGNIEVVIVSVLFFKKVFIRHGNLSTLNLETSFLFQYVEHPRNKIINNNIKMNGNAIIVPQPYLIIFTTSSLEFA